MAWADTLTMIPLDRVAFILGLDPYHFNGITSEIRRNAFTCNDTWYQYDWQASGKLSRESIAMALRHAEDNVTRFLNWTLVPQWFEDEVKFPVYYKPERYSLYNAVGRNKSVETRFGYVQEIGQKTSTFISTPATAFSDSDGDGFNDTVTVTFATTVTVEDELQLYYPLKNGKETWKIRPVTSIDIAAGSATIVFPKYLIPLEVLVKKVPEPGNAHILIDGDDDTNFLQTVDVYRVYSDPAVQVTFEYEPTNCTNGCDNTTDTGCLNIRNTRLGILAYRRANWDADTESYTNACFTNNPEKGTIYYRAGSKDNTLDFPNRAMEPGMERLLVYYALSLIDTELCGCANQRNIWQYMTTDLSRVSPEGSHVVQWDDLRNPFGTTRAAMNLWKQVMHIALRKSPEPR